MRKQSVFAGIAVVAVVLLLTGVLIWGKVLGQRPGAMLVGQKIQPLATKFIAKQAPLVASFLVNPDRLTLYTQLSTPPGKRRALRKEWQQLQTQIKQNWLLDYDRDVKPWLGNELTMAVTTTDIDREPENGFQPGYLLALSIADSKKADRTIEQFWQQAAAQGANLLFEQHQGISVITAESSGTRPSLAGAILGNFALFANNVKVIRNAINDLQVSDLALANFPRYRTTIDRLGEGRIGLAFINLAELGEWGKNAGFLSDDLTNLPPASLAMGLSIKNQAIQAETLLVSDRPWLDAANKPKKANANILTPLMPTDATVFAGQDLEQTWLNLQSALTPYPGINQILTKALERLEAQLGFDMEQYIFNWVHGDFALGILPGNELNWLFLAQKSDGVNTEAALDRLDSQANDRLTVGKITVDQQELTVWTSLKAKDSSIVTGEVAAVHSETPKWVGFASSVPALVSALKPPKITNSLPKQNFAYFDRVSFKWLTPLFGDTLPDLKNPFLSHVKSATITNLEDGNNNILRGQISLKLQ